MSVSWILLFCKFSILTHPIILRNFTSLATIHMFNSVPIILFYNCTKMFFERRCEDVNRSQPAHVSGVEPSYPIAPERVNFYFLSVFRMTNRNRWQQIFTLRRGWGIWMTSNYRNRINFRNTSIPCPTYTADKTVSRLHAHAYSWSWQGIVFEMT